MKPQYKRATVYTQGILGINAGAALAVVEAVFWLNAFTEPVCWVCPGGGDSGRRNRIWPGIARARRSDAAESNHCCQHCASNG